MSESYITGASDDSLDDEADDTMDADLGNAHVYQRSDKIEVPLIELTHLARDLDWYGQGVGNSLMIEMVKKVDSIAEIVGGFMGLHLRSSEGGVDLYERFDFQPFRAHPRADNRRYFMTMRDVRETAKTARKREEEGNMGA